MSKAKMNRGISLEVIDWKRDGTRMWFGGKPLPNSEGGVGYFWIHLWYANGHEGHVTKETFNSAFLKDVPGSTEKPTSKMNVMIRGRDGKFMSYRKLANTDASSAYEAIDALPNI